MTPEKQKLQALALQFGQSGSEDDLESLCAFLMNELPMDQWPAIASTIRGITACDIASACDILEYVPPVIRGEDIGITIESIGPT